MARARTIFEVWSRPDGYQPDEALFCVAVADKGEARAYAARLKASHPDCYYGIRATRRAEDSAGTAVGIWGGGRRERRAHHAHMRSMGLT